MFTRVSNPLDPTDTHSVWFGSTNDDAGHLYENWKARFHHERGKKASAGMLARVKDGWFPGLAPLGYLNDDTHFHPGIILDPVRAPLVKEAFERIAQGEVRIFVLKDITRKGLLAKNGKPLTYSSFDLVLHNPFYYGMMRFQGQLYPGKHEPLISEDLFQKVQQRLAR